ncbi:Tpn1p KNAG_0G01300 [Huiozyma naganishii CBS 8797]|uniref:Vitamin B6 transporter TPN1 n=1 Tax=Huiozyma naganishii (strain ATCC MYA-139 / BCRC 22969 / CBS 8797 / KCTC 17520 / NBRC 10181 / NCYC 3082 / Yp74L-3) TaxID=1071383 RepID=J7RNP4_HUIN7|nr:hypothetical protein KNAG_0G01300 [Kazachstania naganishii CBS 8797]CCK71188.1 hypothetical protein KNAG_0G01300 [Kazachstania naganishii CBS 8797]
MGKKSGDIIVEECVEVGSESRPVEGVVTREHLEESPVQSEGLVKRACRKLEGLSRRIDALGVETTGIERIEPYERGSAGRQFVQVAGFFLSATGGLSSMSSFLLGPLLFGLGFKECLTSGLVSMVIGCLVAAYCSIMGPQSGCRQMVTARYLFGWTFVKLPALASILGVLGWAVVNCVVGGEMLAAISNGKVPIAVGVVIVMVCSFFVAVFGIKQVLKVETLISVPVLTTFLLLYICASDKYKYVSVYNTDSMPRLELKGNWLNFFTLCYSITSTWGSITSDYYILFPEYTPKWQVFTLTFLGTAVPTLFVGVLGLLLSSAAVSYEPWQASYDKHGMGGLLWSGFSRWGGFGRFLVVVLLLSLVSNNIINTYSAAFSIQLSSVHAARIPRWFWCIVCTAVYFVAALVGRNHFSTILGNFLPMIGYWLSMYFMLLLEENELFRRWFLHLYTLEFPGGPESTTTTTTKTAIAVTPRSVDEWKRRHRSAQGHRYNWDRWNDQSVLTHGYAATFAFVCGIAGVVVGMAQAYWIGPVARHFGPEGGDIAMWLAMGISGIVYPPCRYLELRRFGR